MTLPEAVVLLIALLSAGTAAIAIQMARGSRREWNGPPSGYLVPNRLLEVLFAAEDVESWLQGPSLLMFVMAGCEPCHRGLALLRTLEPDRLPTRVAIVKTGGTDAGLVASSPLRALWFDDPERRLGRRFGVTDYPAAVLLWKGRVMGSSSAPLELVSLAALTQ